MKNAIELRDELETIFNELRAGTMEHKTANALSNIVGKTLSSVSIQLKYHEMRDEIPDIAFLNKDKS